MVPVDSPLVSGRSYSVATGPLPDRQGDPGEQAMSPTEKLYRSLQILVKVRTGGLDTLKCSLDGSLETAERRRRSNLVTGIYFKEN